MVVASKADSPRNCRVKEQGREQIVDLAKGFECAPDYKQRAHEKPRRPFDQKGSGGAAHCGGRRSWDGEIPRGRDVVDLARAGLEVQLGNGLTLKYCVNLRRQ